MTIKHIFCASIVLLLLSKAGIAQIEKIETDRPDQTESPFTVPKKWIQFEMGFLKESDKYNSLSLRDFHFHHPALLSKYGLTKCFELRFITEVGTTKEKATPDYYKYTGITSFQFGGKVNFFNEKGWRPKTSLIAHYDFARLRTGYYKDTIDGANFRFTMQHTVSSLLSISYNIGMRWERFGNPPAYIYTFAPGFNLSEDWYAYIEAFGFIWKDESPENSIDAGVAYSINDNFKIDASAGFGINKKAPDNYFAVGASFRFNAAK